MPAKYAMQPQWRQRRAAIGRKGGFEAEMIFESEAVVVKSKPVAPNSPVRIDSIFDMPEIKPIVLPGAWTTVGKGGRPLRGEQKMYDEPQKKKKKKKKTRKSKKAQQDDFSPEADYEEMPSSSDCLVALSRSMLKHEKAVECKHQARHWAKYRQEKAMKMLARDDLIAVLAAKGAFGDVDDTQNLTAAQDGPNRKQWQLNRNDRAERTRRKVRLARAAERCYFEPDETLMDEPVPAWTKKSAAIPVAPPAPEKGQAGSARLAAEVGHGCEEAKVKAEGRAGAKASGRSEARGDDSGKKRRKSNDGRKSNAKNCIMM